jgi:uncharacterized protein YndB with AHSA1/START domain
MSTQAADLTVRKSLTVAAPIERAFEVFTERIGAWWPFESYSIGGEKTTTAVMEGREGGGVYEVMEDGGTAPWATVLAWEPPHRLVLSWHVNPDNPASEVEVRFSPDGDGTRVELEHRGWERFGEKATEASSGYDEGWDLVLGRYVGAVPEGD